MAVPAALRLRAAVLRPARSCQGGSFTVAPEDLIEARQRYDPDTALLVTELRSPTGVLAVTDALTLRPGTELSDDAPAGRRELIRSAVVLDGSVRVRVEIEPRGGASARAAAGGLSVNAWRRPDLDLHVRSSRPLDGLRSVHELRAGEQLDVVLSWGGAHRHHRFGTKDLLAATARSWRRWMEGFDYDSPEAALVRRAALTLKLCDHWSNGALIAAPTSSLPAPIGGVRNWDYRYTWIRDASFSVYAFRRIGFGAEAGAFLGWVLDTFEHGSARKIMYDLEGGAVPDEVVDGELEGYRRSPPVRWGNGAADQRQHDVYGEVLDCAYQWVRGGGPLDEHIWGRLAALADLSMDAWRLPDQGIWEVRSEGRVFTYSAGLCHVALDRAARLAEQLNLPGRCRRGGAQPLVESAYGMGHPGTFHFRGLSSGRLVPSATTVRPITMGLTPRCEASAAPPRTRRSARRAALQARPRSAGRSTWPDATGGCC